MSHSKNRNPQEPGDPKDLESEMENSEKGPDSEDNVGNLLRNERRKQGLSYSEISEITCLRAHILEALENEDWPKLPSPVFVTGFIRAYARALRLDESQLVSLYQKTVPLEAPLPKPLMEPVRSKKPLYIFCVLLLLTMAVAYYLWKEYPTRQKILTSADTITPAENEIEKSRISKELRSGSTSITPLENKDQTTLISQDDSQATDGETREAHMGEKNEETALMPQDDQKTTDGEAREIQMGEKNEETTLMPQDDQKTTDGEAQDLPAEKEEVKKDVHSSIKKSKKPDYEILSLIEDFPQILTASVRERTWIKISVDGGDPKEYIFDPGNRHEWKARKGFDLIIGNADGIDLEFNGEKIENLGAPGQVVRLVFPQYYIERSRN